MTKNDNAMKKMTKLIFAMAVGTALVLACSKEQEFKQDALSNSQEELASQDGKIVFAATADEIGEGSRTTIENGSGSTRVVKWAVGDAIAVWWASDGHGVATANQAGTSSSFSVAGTVSDNYYAGYPASTATALNEGVLTMTVPSSQDGTFASANMMAATTTNSARSFAFKNVSGVLKFTVEGSYTSVVFRGAKGEAVTGSIPVSFSGSGISTGEATGTGLTVTVALNGPGTYYASILPDQTFSEGFSATFYNGENAEPSVSYNKSVTLLKGYVANLGTLDARVQSNLFVTPSGAGTKSGRSWNNAMGVSEFRAFVQQPLDGEGQQITAEDHYKAACVDGVTFHFSAGDYYLAGVADSYLKIEFSGYPKQVEATFLGGYPTGLTGTTTTGRDATTNVTNFTGNSESGILTLGNQTNLSFDGITFRDMGTTQSGIYALFALAGNTGNMTLSCSHCRFIDNKQNSKSYTGAAVCVGKGTSVFSDCTFSGNLARNGCALNVYPDATVNVANCTFSGNETWNTSGALQNEGGKLTVDDCTFANNQSGKDSTMFAAGGAFHTNGSGAETTFNRCTFSGNRSKQGGAMSIQTAKVTCNNCTFSDNVSYKSEGKISSKPGIKDKLAGGAIAVLTSGSELTLNSCSFTGNSAPYACGGAIYIHSAKSVQINAGTTFSGNTALLSGGAVFANANMTVSGTSASPVAFTNNKTTFTWSQYANGGAVYIREGTTSSISRAVFTGNEAGQATETEFEFSNGGAISMEGVTKFTATNCEFSGNLGRNGACVDLRLGTASDCQFNNCYFHDNNSRYMVGTTAKGNFSGGVGRIGYGTAVFNQCRFKKNSAYHRSGAFHINGAMGALVCNGCSFEENYNEGEGGFSSGAICVEHGRAELNNCDFNGNYSVKGFAGVIGVSNNSVLKMNGCLFRNNYCATRGMIQVNAGCLVFINRSSFYNNWTTGTKGWGVVVHSSSASICMHNVLAYGNKCTNSSPDTSISFNSDGGWLVTNSTIVDNCKNGVFRANNSTFKTVFCNNIIVNRYYAGSVFHTDAGFGIFTDYGHNVLSYPSTPSKPTLVSTDLIGNTDSSLGGSYVEQLTTEPYYACYQWNGSLSGFTAATATEVENAIKAYDHSYTAESSSTNSNISSIVQAFYDWPSGLNALTVDIRNVSRTGTMWPGSYQNN